MIHVAIVEDDIKYIQLLSGYIDRFSQEKNEKIEIATFMDGDDIVYEYKANYDIIFMDIQMKHMDGLKTAKNIRKVDRDVILIFITNMAQYAIQGYSVNAMDYVLKPVSYFAFSEELDKAIRKLNESVSAFVAIKQEGGFLRLDVKKIVYIESQGHTILIHTENYDYKTIGTMKNYEQQLLNQQFTRCNNCYLINLRYVESVQQSSVTVAGRTLQISRPRKKCFMDALTDYVGGEFI
jgi:DNA-binding LytR/AlgR family response regulator